MEKIHNPTLADTICEPRVTKIKKTFFNHVNQIIDWKAIENILKKYDKNGKSTTGKPSYNGLLLFKISLLQQWYDLSDYEVEDRINDSISFSHFCGLHIDQVAPDHSTLSRFRSRLSKAKGYNLLFAEIATQLQAKGATVHNGLLKEASISILEDSES